MKKRRTPFVSSTAVKAAKALLCLILWLVLASLLNACTTQQATASIPRNDSISVTRNDSAAISHSFERLRQYIRDSVIIREKGDTIIIDHWRIQIKDSIVLVKDTIYKDKEHIVYKDKEVLVQLPPERYIPSWAWYSLGASILFFILFLLIIYIKIYFRRF